MQKMKNLQWAAVAAAILLAVGCASGGGGAPAGPSDEELIGSMVDSAMEALKAKDIDSLIAAYSDDFSSDNGDKGDTEAFLRGIADQGLLDGIEVDSTGMEIAVEGTTATAGPIALEAAFGVVNLSFDLEKRDGRWWVTGQHQE